MTKKIDVDFAKLEELRERYEPLREELHEYLEETEVGYFIRNPFCNEPVHDLDHCGLIHHRIDTWAEKADECFEALNAEGEINCIEIYSHPEWFKRNATCCRMTATG